VGVVFSVSGQDPVIQAVQQLDQRLQHLQTTQKQTAESTGILARSADGLRDLVTRLAGAFAVERMVAFGKEAINAAAEIGRLSERTGVTTETLSALKQVTEDQGLTIDDLATSFKFLAKNMTALEEGSPKASRAFALIGLSAKDLKGLSLDQALQKVSDAFDRFGDGPGKIAAAVALLGKSGDIALPVLKQIAEQKLTGLTEEARQLGILVSPEQAQQAREFAKAMHDLGDSFEGLARTTLGPILPGLAQPAAYTTAQLTAFRTGERKNDGDGIMQAIAKRLSDADTKALGEYYAGMR